MKYLSWYLNDLILSTPTEGAMDPGTKLLHKFDQCCNLSPFDSHL